MQFLPWVIAIFTNRKAQQSAVQFIFQVKRSKGTELQLQLEMSESFIFRPSVPALGFFVPSKVEKFL